MQLSGQIHILAALLPVKEPSELGGPMSQSGHTEKQKHLLTFQRIKPQTSHCTDYAVPPPEAWHFYMKYLDSNFRRYMAPVHFNLLIYVTEHSKIELTVTEHSMGHSKMQLTVTSGSIMYFSRFSQQLLECWVSLGPLLCTGIYLFQSVRNNLPLSRVIE
jgi:hypothetical protein